MQAHRAFLLLSIPALLLSACGFEPMYGNHDASGPTSASHAGALSQQVAVDATTGTDIKTRYLAQQFGTDLENILHPDGARASGTPYKLSAVLSSQEVPLAISPDGTTSRSSVIILANLTLTRSVDGALLYQGQARHIGSYDNVNNAFYSTYVSEQDAYRRAVTELAEDVRMRLATFFSQNPDPHPMHTPVTAKTGSPKARPASPVLPLLPATAPAMGGA